MIKKEEHDNILREFHSRYIDKENDTCEFTWDGPSDWETWYANIPRTIFLLKEAWQEFQPGEATEKVDNMFFRNLLRWQYAINNSVNNEIKLFPDGEILPSNNNSLCIVEVKKLNE